MSKKQQLDDVELLYSGMNKNQKDNRILFSQIREQVDRAILIYLFLAGKTNGGCNPVEIRANRLG